LEFYLSMLNMDSKSYYQSAFIVNGLKAVAAQVWPESDGFYPVRVALQSNPLVYERLAVLVPVLLYMKVHGPVVLLDCHPPATLGDQRVYADISAGASLLGYGPRWRGGNDGPPIEWIVMQGYYLPQLHSMCKILL
jgi:hypothetical protein